MHDNRVVVSVLVKNRQGALLRVSNVFTRRGINIKQLTVAETRNPDYSRITVLVIDDGNFDHWHITTQLNKVEYVVDAVILPYEKTISKELLLIKIAYTEKELKDLQEVLFDHSGKIISFDSKNLVGQIVGSNAKIDTFLQKIAKFKIVEICRSGVTALDISHKTFAETSMVVPDIIEDGE